MSTIKFASLPPVSKAFFLDFSSRVMAIGGAIGTGKTFLQALRILFKATHIVPCPDGVRRSSFIIVRKRYGDLEQSVVPAFEKIAGAAFDLSGRKSPLYGKIYFKDKFGKVECDLWLYAFETVADAQKIRSLAFTDGAIIEAQELDSGIIVKEVFKRLGRYPAPVNADELDDFENNPMIAYQLPNSQIARGKQLTLDFNYTNSTHWLKKYLVDDNKANEEGVRRRTLYEQPPTHIWMPGSRLDGSIQGVEGRYHGEEGVFMRNPEALHYIKHNGWSYWEDILLESMGDDALIQQDILASWGDYINGKPVYPKFSRTRHVAQQGLKYIPGRPVYVGVDNGFNNAWIFAQQDHSGRVLIIDEVVNVGADAKSIKAALKDDVIPYLNLHLPLHTVIFVADQAFWNGEGGEGRKQIEVLTNEGLTVEKSSFKFTTPMRDVVDTAIATEQLLVSPRCNRFIDAMVGGFHYPLVRSTGSFSEEPNQNSEHSHPANAGEFVISRLIQATPRKRKSSGKSKREFSYV